MNWHTVYDIGNSKAPEFIVYLYFGAALLGVALLFQLWALRRRQSSGTAKILALFALLIAGLGYGVNTWDHNRLAAKLAGGDVLQATGPISGHQIWEEDVTDIKRDIGRRYRKWETINAGGVAFTWTPGAQEPAFTNAQTPAVDLRDGLTVRIHYVEDIPGQAHQRRIVRLEVSDAPPPSPEFVPLPGAPFPSRAVPAYTLPATLDRDAK